MSPVRRFYAVKNLPEPIRDLIGALAKRMKSPQADIITKAVIDFADRYRTELGLTEDLSKLNQPTEAETLARYRAAVSDLPLPRLTQADLQDEPEEDTTPRTAQEFSTYDAYKVALGDPPTPKRSTP